MGFALERPHINLQKELMDMDRLFDRLFPICRSIMGEGVRETLSILCDQIPLEVHSVATGTQVYDWTIPKEWKIRQGWLKDPNGNLIADFSKNNLSIVNYSAPINCKLSLEELKNHLHTIPRLPGAIPYVTSYYKERWGFCLPFSVYENLQEGDYHAFIDSEFIDGEMNYAHYCLQGDSQQEILLSTYICHPSMANNELSGPIVAAYVYKRLSLWANRRFSYRFVFVPETIGSISYLAAYGKAMKENVFSGLVLTCVGGNTGLNYKLSRQGNAPIDNMVKHLFERNCLSGTIRPFTPIYGSDERQYCSPGFNLPVGQMARMVYGQYPGYHNSLDTKEAMTVESLQRSADEIELLLFAMENDGYYINQYPYGEVKLDRHQLYPDMNAPSNRRSSNNQLMDQRQFLNRVLMVLNYSDGEHSLLEIAEKCDTSILDMIPVVRVLLEKKLIKGPYNEPRGLMP